MKNSVLTFCLLALVPASAFGQCVRFGDTVYLEVANGDGHLSARQWNSEVRTDAGQAQGWEAFVVLDPFGTMGGPFVDDGDAIALWSVAHGTKLQGRPPAGGSGDVYQTRNPIDAWETWTVETVAGNGCAAFNTGDIRLVSDHGTYLYSGSDGRARTHVSVFGNAARFRIRAAPATAFICEEPLREQGFSVSGAWAPWEWAVSARHGAAWADRNNAANISFRPLDDFGRLEVVARPCLPL